ncbi:hypothetical protein H4V99_002640 [Cryobacterium sp. CG_9.6]|nr:hypothetical protein [Cryobacterium sp. CG_9.6]
MHGGAAPQVRAAAQVRLLMRADDLMSALLRIALDDKLPLQHRLVAIRDGLDRANLAGKQEIEIGVTTNSTFDDVLEGVLIDVAEEDLNVIDAVVVDEEDAVQSRRDVSVFREVERQKRQRRAATNAERAEQERELFAQAPPEPETRASKLTRAQYLLAREGGANFSSRGLGVDAAEAGDGRRKARSSRADLG